MLVTTTAKLEYVGTMLNATVTLPNGKTAKVELRNPKWEKPDQLEALNGKTYKLQGHVKLNAELQRFDDLKDREQSRDSLFKNTSHYLGTEGTQGLFIIDRMKRAAFTPR